MGAMALPVSAETGLSASSAQATAGMQAASKGAAQSTWRTRETMTKYPHEPIGYISPYIVILERAIGQPLPVHHNAAEKSASAGDVRCALPAARSPARPVSGPRDHRHERIAVAAMGQQPGLDR